MKESDKPGQEEMREKAMCCRKKSSEAEEKNRKEGQRVLTSLLTCPWKRTAERRKIVAWEGLRSGPEVRVDGACLLWNNSPG